MLLLLALLLLATAHTACEQPQELCLGLGAWLPSLGEVLLLCLLLCHRVGVHVRILNCQVGPISDRVLMRCSLGEDLPERLRAVAQLTVILHQHGGEGSAGF